MMKVKMAMMGISSLRSSQRSEPFKVGELRRGRRLGQVQLDVVLVAQVPHVGIFGQLLLFAVGRRVDESMAAAHGHSSGQRRQEQTDRDSGGDAGGASAAAAARLARSVDFGCDSR